MLGFFCIFLIYRSINAAACLSASISTCGCVLLGVIACDLFDKTFCVATVFCRSRNKASFKSVLEMPLFTALIILGPVCNVRRIIVRPGADTGGMHPPTRPKEVLTWHDFIKSSPKYFCTAHYLIFSKTTSQKRFFVSLDEVPCLWKPI